MYFHPLRILIKFVPVPWYFLVNCSSLTHPCPPGQAHLPPTQFLPWEGSFAWNQKAGRKMKPATILCVQLQPELRNRILPQPRRPIWLGISLGISVPQSLPTSVYVPELSPLKSHFILLAKTIITKPFPKKTHRKILYYYQDIIICSKITQMSELSVSESRN